MATEENDLNIPSKVGELFRNFEAEPPPQAWETIRARLAADVPKASSGWTLRNLADWFQPMNRLYPALAVIGLALIILVVWIGVKPSGEIKGQAMVDQEKLSRGTAYLMRVQDRETPFDSVRFYDKTGLDSTGHFSFRHLPSGSYLLRVHVHPNSPYSPAYHHSYYGDQLHWNRATLIHTDDKQDFFTVRVPPLLSK